MFNILYTDLGCCGKVYLSLHVPMAKVKKHYIL